MYINVTIVEEKIKSLYKNNEVTLSFEKTESAEKKKI